MGTYGGYSAFGNGGLQDLANRFTMAQRGPSPDERLSYAQQMYPGGRQIGGDWVHQGANGFQYSTPMTAMTPPGYRDPWAGPTSALMGAFLRDSDVFQQAADRQFGRNQDQIDQMQLSLTGGLGQARDAYDQALQLQSGFGDQLLANQGTAVDNILGAAGDFRSMIPGLIDPAQQAIGQGQEMAQGVYDEAMGYEAPDLQSHAMAAYGRAEETVDQFGVDRAAYERAAWDDAQAIADGVRSQMEDARNQAYSTMNPDGTRKTPAQAAADSIQFSRASQEMVSSVMSEFSGKIRDTQARMADTMAQLGLTAAQFRGQVGEAAAREAELELSGLSIANQAAGLMTQLASAGADVARTGGDLYARVADYQLQAEQMRAQYDQFQETWNENRINLLSSFPLAALGMEMQGRQQIATLVQQNPESYVSWFEGLLGLYSAMASARGTTMAGGGGGTGEVWRGDQYGQYTV